jgi:hypothetical protein
MTFGVAQLQGHRPDERHGIAAGGKGLAAHDEIEWNVCLDDPLVTLRVDSGAQHQDTQQK